MPGIMWRTMSMGMRITTPPITTNNGMTVAVT